MTFQYPAITISLNLGSNQFGRLIYNCNIVYDYFLQDPQNKDGGKWVTRLKKGFGTKFWEELVRRRGFNTFDCFLEQVFALIGEQFETTEYICGIVISTRYNEDLLSVWTKDSGNQEAQNKIL